MEENLIKEDYVVIRIKDHITLYYIYYYRIFNAVAYYDSLNFIEVEENSLINGFPVIECKLICCGGSYPLIKLGLVKYFIKNEANCLDQWTSVVSDENIAIKRDLKKLWKSVFPHSDEFEVSPWGSEIKNGDFTKIGFHYI